jgi:hypothetical protein
MASSRSSARGHARAAPPLTTPVITASCHTYRYRTT